MAKVKPINIDMKGLEEASKPSTPSFDTTRLGDRAAEARNLNATRAQERRDTAPKGQSFGQAFSEARKAGLTTFKWNGGSYGTKMKGETSSAKPASPYSASTSMKDIARNTSTSNSRPPAPSKSTNPYSSNTPTKNIARNTKTDNSQMSDAQNRKFMSDNERGYEETAARKLANPISRVAKATGTAVAAPSISSSRAAPKAAAPKSTGFSVDTKALAKATTDSLSTAASRAVPRTGYSNAPKSSSGTGYGSFKK